jgi:hypothetical protein
MSKGLKIALIIFGILALLGGVMIFLCITGVTLGTGLSLFKIGDAVIEEYNNFGEEFLTEACEDLQGADYTEAEYEKLFSSEFKSEYSYEESKVEIGKVLPKGSCPDFKIENFWDMVKKGMSVNYNNDALGNTTLTLSILHDGEYITFYMIKESGDWKIQSITNSPQAAD